MRRGRRAKPTDAVTAATREEVTKLVHEQLHKITVGAVTNTRLETSEEEDEDFARVVV